MRAEIVAVGTEVLLGDIVDSNSAELGRSLAKFGVFHFWRQTVGDNVERLESAIRLALSRSDIVFTIGGLGPTTDDLTRDGIVRALDDTLVFDESVEQDIRRKLARRKIEFLENQKRQCMRPSSAEPIDNPNGTAPGLLCRKDGKVLIAMPGPRREFEPMVAKSIEPFLASLGQGVIHAQVVRLVGVPESQVQEKIEDLMERENPTVAPYVKTGEVHVRIRAHAGSVEEADRLIAPVRSSIEVRLREFVLGSGEESAEETVLNLLRVRSETLAVAESCTGGGLGSRITSVSGSSDVFLGGVISYSNELKRSLLGVSAETLDKLGAVSEECAREMAAGVRKATGADWGVSVTGIAGPGGGTKDKPVGLVYIGLDGPHGSSVVRNEFIGDRDNVRERSIHAALAMLLKNVTFSDQ
jgi:nicotinamide-nucleotide amidase